MRRIASVLGVVLVVAAALPAAGKAAKKAKAPSRLKVAGASTVVPAAWGLVAVGGPSLRILPNGKTKWQTVHTIKGDHIYRAAADDAGRILVSWDKDASIHLFVPAKKEHRTFAKPKAPSAEFKYEFNLEDFYFAENGAAAIVYMHGFTGGRMWSTVAYRFDLSDEKAEPTLLFKQPGHMLHSSPRVAAFAMAKKEEDGCEYNFCSPMAGVFAWEIEGSKATKKVILDGSKTDKYARARLVWGSDDERVVVLIDEHPSKRNVLRWRHGEAKGTLRALPAGPASAYDTETMWLTKSDDLIEVWMTDDRGLEIRRYPPKGDATVTRLAPIPKKNENDYPLFGVYGLKERRNGELVMHRGDSLVLLGTDGPARQVSLETLLGRTGEWAGALIYVPEPEGIWVGIEGGGRSMYYVPFADIDKLAQPVE